MKLNLYTLLSNAYIERRGAHGKKIKVSLVYLMAQETLQDIQDTIGHEFPGQTEVDERAMMVKVRGQWVDIKDYIEEEDEHESDTRAARRVQGVL